MTYRVWTIVLDDDPTGTQGITDVPAVIDPALDTLRWARDHADIAYVLTNTRALTPVAAAEKVRQVVQAVTSTVGQESMDQVRFISRGDSTLRGHFPLEISILLETSPVSYSGCVLVPAFPAAQRVTLDGVHYVAVDGVLAPVGTSEFARDATFGYPESILTEWARHRIPLEWDVVRIPSSAFDGGFTAVQAMLTDVQQFTVFCPDIRNEEDLRILAEAQSATESSGVHLLVQSAPSYPPVLAGLSSGQPLDTPTFTDGPGLIVVGSHTSVTSQQLLPLTAAGIPYVEIDARRIAAGHGATEVQRCVTTAAASLRTQTTILATSRDIHLGNSPAESLEVAGAIAQVITEITRELIHQTNPSFIISKGGITSHNMLSASLAWRAGTVVGPLVDATLPVWRNWKDLSTPLCVIAPGNVGAPNLLTRALQRINDLTLVRRSL